MKRLAVIFTALVILANLSAASAGETEKLSASLRLLRDLREDPRIERGMLGSAAAVLQDEKVTLTVKFDHVLSPSEIAEYESRGASFHYLNGEIARTRSIYPVCSSS